MARSTQPQRKEISCPSAYVASILCSKSSPIWVSFYRDLLGFALIENARPPPGTRRIRLGPVSLCPRHRNHAQYRQRLGRAAHGVLIRPASPRTSAHASSSAVPASTAPAVICANRASISSNPTLPGRAGSSSPSKPPTASASASSRRQIIEKERGKPAAIPLGHKDYRQS